jgi:hypothetical protein
MTAAATLKSYSFSHKSSIQLCKNPLRALVPVKVCIFTWRLLQGSLSTQCNRKKKELHATCQVCGAEQENGHHAVVRYEVRQIRNLSDEIQFQHSSPDWLLLLLSSVDKAEDA